MKIVMHLMEQPTSLTELAKQGDESLKAVSQRLRMLVAAGIVVRRREGKQVIYAIADQEVGGLIEAGRARALRASPYPCSNYVDEEAIPASEPESLPARLNETAL